MASRLPPSLGASNRRVRLLRELDQRKHRTASGLTLVEGIRLCETAAAAGAVFRMLLVTESVWTHLPPALVDRVAAGGTTELWTVTPELMDRISPTETPSGLLAAVEIPSYRLPSPPYADDFLLLVLDDVADPGNAGTLIRSADAAGSSGVLMLGGVDPWNPKVVRSTMGSCFHLPVVVAVGAGRDDGAGSGAKPGVVEAHASIIALKAVGVRIAVAHPRAEAALWDTDLRGPIALVLGNEAHGIGPAMLAAADVLVSIPNFGRAESLNVAQAGTVLLFEAARQRQIAS